MDNQSENLTFGKNSLAQPNEELYKVTDDKNFNTKKKITAEDIKLNTYQASNQDVESQEIIIRKLIKSKNEFEHNKE